jgi:hypothetical protein
MPKPRCALDDSERRAGSEPIAVRPNALLECGGRMKWRRRPAYSPVRSEIERTGGSRNRRGGVAARRTRSATALHTSSRHRVVPATTPRMATAHTFQRQPDSPHCTVGADGFQRVSRTTRRKPTPPKRAEQHRLRGRKDHAIDLHQRYQYELQEIHDSPFKRPALASAAR